MTESYSIVHGAPKGSTGLPSEENKQHDESHVDDQTHLHVWVWEDAESSVLTKEGLNNIANHKYTPGTYTILDTALNPIWAALTDLLPMSLAPNMVTTLGGLHCGLAYAVTWYYSPNFDLTVPDWVCVLNGYCIIAYYTLDCMDGKQARRTGTSSPLGQLFDHGFDCICNLAHLSNIAAFSMLGGSYYYFLIQATLQFCFFMAQWEEYYTHILPHSSGNIGVTEVNYFMGLISLLNGFIDRDAFYKAPMNQILPSVVLEMIPESYNHYAEEYEVRHVGAILWTIFSFGLITLSFGRTFKHLKDPRKCLVATSKLLSPALLCIGFFHIQPSIITQCSRAISVAFGLAFSIITKKMIIYSMAKMSFAALQLEIVPLLALGVLWKGYDDKFTLDGVKLLWRSLSVWYAYRLITFARSAINEICARLDINCFTIKPKKKDKAE
mmetsp:Transcript_14579/g.20605  ORF Transcript_14579/g.20605 Transcript_14579/m.20605 type:complete len:439 (-) Transcript_14579:230-1546(-)